MPYADNQGVRIHYKVEGSGLPLVLQHGFTQSVEDWYECGYVEAPTLARHVAWFSTSVDIDTSLRRPRWHSRT
jgi:hypothetical protein